MVKASASLFIVGQYLVLFRGNGVGPPAGAMRVAFSAWLSYVACSPLSVMSVFKECSLVVQRWPYQTGRVLPQTALRRVHHTDGANRSRLCSCRLLILITERRRSQVGLVLVSGYYLRYLVKLFSFHTKVEDDQRERLPFVSIEVK